MNKETRRGIPLAAEVDPLAFEPVAEPVVVAAAVVVAVVAEIESVVVVVALSVVAELAREKKRCWANVFQAAAEQGSVSEEKAVFAVLVMAVVAFVLVVVAFVVVVVVAGKQIKGKSQLQGCARHFD